MNTLKIIAFHPERLREMILGNERKAVASLTTFGLIVYLLFLLCVYASSSMVLAHIFVLFYGTAYALEMVVFGLMFSRFVSTQQILFKQTFYMVCYVMLLWHLFFIVFFIVYFIADEFALLRSLAEFIIIGFSILSIVHLFWFFKRSHDISYLKIFVALIASSFYFFVLLLGLFFLIILVLPVLFPPAV